MSVRGTYGFELKSNGYLIDNSQNVERLRRLFRDDTIIKGKFGPGEPGDFDYGSWHILCHLAAGAGVYDRNNRRLWVGITHKRSRDEYAATVSFRDNKEIKIIALDSAKGQELIKGARLLGFIEGSSCGHILARGVIDPPSLFNGWSRQDFDQRVKSKKEGGTVWEHWCTTRDIRESNTVGNTLLRGYLTLVATLGGKFVSAVARGRRSHEHPLQLCALVKAGVLTDAEAIWETAPLIIPKNIQKLLYEARPEDYVRAAEELSWPQTEISCYFMFKRGISSWNQTAAVRADLASFGI